MKNEIKKIIEKAVEEFFGEEAGFEMPKIEVDYPKNETFGDYTTNVAMVLGRILKKNPMEVAEKLSSAISHKPSAIENFKEIKAATPGHINFRLSEKYLHGVVEKMGGEKESFGDSQIGNGAKVNNEFISANPTGPLHLGNGRGGFFGDSLSRVLKKAGFEVTNEYYVNDAGGQVLKLGHSVLKDREAVYEGEYIDDLNKKFGNLVNVREVGEKSANEIVENILKKTVEEKMKISFDVWVSEKKIQDEGYVEKAIGTLKEKGMTYESEGALWLKTTEFGDEKDRVLVKSDGKNAYFASDCGYLLNKMERGFDRMIMSLGADHHGYLSRIKAAAEALGFEGDFRILISQMVRLVKDGKEARMSKRAGNVVYIDDLIDDLGHDVVRFFFLMYSPDTHMNFDLGLAKERSNKNPVFYVQYAYARICSILKNAENTFDNLHLTIDKDVKLSLLNHEKELDLMRELNKFPELIEEIAQDYEVHRLPYYAMKLADKFHSFYDACRVIDEENEEMTKARLKLVDSTRIVLAETLRLIGVSAPESM